MEIITIGSLLKDYIQGRPVWNYEIFCPRSFDDSANIKVIITYGRNEAEFKEEYILDISWCTIIPKRQTSEKSAR